MEKKTTNIKTYNIKLITYNDGTSKLNRTNDGFTRFELLGLASQIQYEFCQDVAEQIKPTIIERKFIKRTK